MPEKPKKLYRSNTDRVIFGVCGGLGEYFEMDSTIFRLIFILLTFAGGAGPLLYIVSALIIPAKPGTEKRGEEEVKEFAENVKEKAQDVVHELKEHSPLKRNALGFLLIIFGLAFLTKELFPHSLFWLRWGIVWPILVLLLGLKIIISNK